ncbi:UNVERIFIED_CONTAM: hypothetical protein RMT77_017267 [Armadillidium vulgare]
MWIRICTLLSTLLNFQENAVNSVAAPPVKFTIFFDIFCIDSIKFFANQMRFFYINFRNITIVDLYAYGYVLDFPSLDPRRKKYIFRCSKGPDECYGNMFLECAKKYIANRDTHLKFVICVMRSKNGPIGGFEECCRSNGISYPKIRQCSISDEGNQLLHNAGVIQRKMTPYIREVPLVLVNGKYGGKNFEKVKNQGLSITHILQFICKHYKGPIPKIKYFYPNS